MKIFAFVVAIILCGTALTSSQASKIDCDFQYGYPSLPSRTKCRYQNGWDGMVQGNWKITSRTRDKKIQLPVGFFAYFDAKKRSPGFSSRFISPVASVDDDSCVTFIYINRGPKAPYPNGRSALEVYFMPNGRAIREDDKPLWVSTKRTKNVGPKRQHRWAKAKIPLAKVSIGEKLNGSVVFAAVRGASRRAYIGIDYVEIKRCRGDTRNRLPPLEDNEDSNRTASETESEVSSRPGEFIRALAAHRSVKTREFSLIPGLNFDSSSQDTHPSFETRPRRRGNNRSRGNKRKGRRNRKRPRNELRVVYFTEEPQEPSSEEPFVPTLVGQERPQELCDFSQYTKGLQKCLRVFFSMLGQHRSSTRCNTDYYILEKCLQAAATKCVPSSEMTFEQVNELVSDTLRNKFKTQQVYCLEEGAFVFPEFQVGSIPLQCTREYFGKLSGCGGSFAGLFNFKHGDPNLCREYFQANECQRQTTAEECNFEPRSMIIYGLNLQYQFAHNPFCIDLPFSSWWPSVE